MVPVAIIVALALTAVGGSGLGGLGAFSQVVSGPRAAGSDLTVDDGDSEIGSAVTQLAAGGPGAPVTPGAPNTLTGPNAPGGGGEVPGGTQPPPGGDGPGGGQPTPPGGGGGTPAPPAPPVPGQPGVVDGVGEALQDATGGTPVVGPTVEDAVDGLLEVCGRLGCP